MIKTNYHTHSVFCDGNDTVFDMSQTAYEKGFSHLGFSGHSYMENARAETMDNQTLIKYYDQVNRCKETFDGKLNIYCGLEQDCFSLKSPIKFEYLIGSVHNVKKDGKLLFFDSGIAQTQTIIEQEYSGSYLAFAKDYFSTVENVIDMTGADIIGHIDLCSKFNERLNNSQSEEYLEYAQKAVDKLLKTGAVFEINTGAMARGYRTSPYPSIEILKMIYLGGGKIMINSDCHKKEFLDFGFDVAVDLAKKVGFDQTYIFTKDGFVAQKI